MKRWAGVLAVWVGVAVSGGGQALAHKNWEGSGLTVQAWWSRALFCAAGDDLKRVAGEMDALERMGCDAVEVNPGSGYGAVTEMDAVTDGAGQRKMRVVVDLDGAEADVRGRMGFWGARGAAGFAVRGLGDEAVGRLRQAAGGRVLVADGSGGQLWVRRMPEASAGLREWLAGTVKAGIMLEDGGARLGYARAAMLLTSGTAARVKVDAVLPAGNGTDESREFSAEELLLWVPKQRVAKDGMVEWVRALSELRQQNAGLRAGKPIFLVLDAPGALGWMVPARDGQRAVVVVCNLSGRALTVPVAGAVRAGGVRGTLVKTLLRSDDGTGKAASLDGLELGDSGVFVGEIR